MCKNNQTFSNDRSCSCRKVNRFLRRKAGYCQSSTTMLEGGFAMRARCSPSSFHPALCVCAREAGWSQPPPLCWCKWEQQEVSPAFSLAEMGSAAALARWSWFWPLSCLLQHCWTGGYPQAAEKPGKETKPWGKSTAFLQISFPISPWTEIIHKESSDFIHLPAHEVSSD